MKEKEKEKEKEKNGKRGQSESVSFVFLCFIFLLQLSSNISVSLVHWQDFMELTNNTIARLIFMNAADRENNFAAAGNFAYAIYWYLFKETLQTSRTNFQSGKWKEYK